MSRVCACVCIAPRRPSKKPDPTIPLSPFSGRALELFLDRLVKAAAALMTERGDKMLTAGHFKAVVAADPVFDFCRDLLKDAPDLADPATKKKKGGGGGGGGASGAKRKPAAGAGAAKKKNKKTASSSDEEEDYESDGPSSSEPAAAEPAAAAEAKPEPVEQAAAPAPAAEEAAPPPPPDAPPSDVVPMPPLDNAADYVQFEDDFDA